MTTRLALARWISIAGHPFAFIALLVVMAGSKRYGIGGAVRLITVTAIVLIIPLWVFMWRKWRSGRWQTVDASDPRNRPSFYGVAFLLLGLLMGCFVFVEGWSFMLRGCAAVAVLLGLAAILNRWIKLSNHVRVRDVHRSPAESFCAGLGSGSSGARPFRCMVSADAFATYIARSARRHGSWSPCGGCRSLGLTHVTSSGKSLFPTQLALT